MNERRTMMKRTIFAATVAMALMGLATTAAWSQASAPGTGRAPGQGMGPGMGMGMGPMHGWHMDRDNTPGWSMMTRAERAQHHEHMAGMKDHAQCSAYMAQHHAAMVERAKERGRTLPAQPRHDACAPLKK
jgi:hypothetical protein